ncbi:MAG: TIGR04283 family arsenosugar biosynthesis glycosyltransferase, partial [Planctomycetota bacterium]
MAGQQMCDWRLPTVSVVIPTLNEADHITCCIRSLPHAPVIEIIVADGGSRDETVPIARALGAIVVQSSRGRARQMNAGSAVAAGDVLLFLHADCTLAPGAIGHLRRVMAQRRHVAGFFRQRIASRHPFFRLIEAGSNIRARWLLRPYGDQAMFLLRSVFEQIGGFADVPVLEDLHMARALRR